MPAVRIHDQHLPVEVQQGVECRIRSLRHFRWLSYQDNSSKRCLPAAQAACNCSAADASSIQRHQDSPGRRTLAAASLPDMPRSFLGAPAGEMRLAQIELPLDPAPRLVFELAAAKQLVDVRSFGGDQLELDFLVNLGEPSMALVTIAAVLDVLEPLAVTGTERANEPLRQAAFRPELVEPLD